MLQDISSSAPRTREDPFYSGTCSVRVLLLKIIRIFTIIVYKVVLVYHIVKLTPFYAIMNIRVPPP